MALALGVSAAVAAGGYLLYGYATGWRGKAYGWLGGRRSTPRTPESLFFGQIACDDADKRNEARAWMEKYVRTKLLRQKQDRKASSLAAKGAQTPSGLAAADTLLSGREGGRPRSDSLIRGGTGRYAEDLGNCIATEKGLLKREDFEHIQKVIEVYSKAVLRPLRLEH